VSPDLNGQAGLAAPARANQADQPVRLQLVADHGDGGLAPDEARELAW
jgi:hypothetical protein